MAAVIVFATCPAKAGLHGESVMAWIAAELARSTYRHLGIFLGSEWRECGERLGLRFEIVPLRAGIRATRVGWVIFLSDGMSPRETAWLAWHEIAHVLLHPCNILSPVGRPLQGKCERQANEFAALFPHWDVPDVTFDGNWPRKVSWDIESERRFVGCAWGGGV